MDSDAAAEVRSLDVVDGDGDGLWIMAYDTNGWGMSFFACGVYINRDPNRSTSHGQLERGVTRVKVLYVAIILCNLEVFSSQLMQVA